MTKLRRWADPVDPIEAERLFGRFVHSVNRQRRSAKQPASQEPTTRVASPNKPPRRSDEATATFRQQVADEAEGDRRILRQDESEAVLDNSARRQFIVELTALYRHGHVDDVMKELERIRSQYPNDVELHGAMADFFLDKGDLLRATEMLFAMVTSYFERADGEAARRCLERIKSLDPENQRLRRFEKMMTAASR